MFSVQSFVLNCGEGGGKFLFAWLVSVGIAALIGKIKGDETSAMWSRATVASLAAFSVLILATMTVLPDRGGRNLTGNLAYFVFLFAWLAARRSALKADEGVKTTHPAVMAIAVALPLFAVLGFAVSASRSSLPGAGQTSAGENLAVSEKATAQIEKADDNPTRDIHNTKGKWDVKTLKERKDYSVSNADDGLGVSFGVDFHCSDNGGLAMSHSWLIVFLKGRPEAGALSFKNGATVPFDKVTFYPNIAEDKEEYPAHAFLWNHRSDYKMTVGELLAHFEAKAFVSQALPVESPGRIDVTPPIPNTGRPYISFVYDRRELAEAMGKMFDLCRTKTLPALQDR